MWQSRRASIPLAGRQETLSAPTQDPPAAPGPVHEEAFRALVRVSGLLRRVVEPRMASLGLSGAQWGVLRSLRRLERAGAPCPRAAELGSMLLVQPPSLSTTLDRMERAGLVSRLKDDADRRARRIQLTPAGRRLIERGLRDHSEWIARLMAGLAPAEQAKLKTLLVNLGEHLGRVADGVPNHQVPHETAPRRKNQGRSKRS